MKTELSTWEIYFDHQGVQTPLELSNQAQWQPIEVPSVWQEINPDYDGVAWYRKEIRLTAEDLQQHLRLCFGAVHYCCVVFCNDTQVGIHEGGYTPFSIPIDSIAREGNNTIHVRVLGPARDREIEGFRAGSPIHQSNIPTWKAGWHYAFGGLWQSVHLEKIPRIFAHNLFIKTSIAPKEAHVSFEIENLDSDSSSPVLVRWHIRPWSKDDDSTAAIANGSFETNLDRSTSPENKTCFSANLSEAHLWDLDNPHLYVLTIEIESNTGTHKMEERFGLRSFSTDGRYFFLNEKRIIIVGTLHQGIFPKRIAAPHDEAMAKRDMQLLKEANCNFVRLHIKPAPVCTLDIADELGILCMGEPPIGWITHDDKVQSRAIHNVREMARRDRNHPSLVLWCLFNELSDSIYTDTADDRTLIEPCHKATWEIDDSRLLINTSGGRNALSLDHKNKNSIRVPGLPKSLPILDVHPYKRIPLRSESIKEVQTMGTGKEGMLFTSEFGTSGFPNMDQLIEGYSEDEKELYLRDYQQMKNYRDQLVFGYKRYHLADHFGTLTQFYEALQLDHCQATNSLQRSLRSNERNAGYIITQHADAGSEFGGIVDLWRKPKRVFDIFKECNKDQLLTIHLDESSVYLDEKLKVSVKVSDFTPDAIIATGELTIKQSEKIIDRHTLNGKGDLLAECFNQSITLPCEGLYTLEAQCLVGNQELSHTVSIRVFTKPSSVPKEVIYFYDLAEEGPSLEDCLQKCGYQTKVFRNQHNDPAIPAVIRLHGRYRIQQNTEIQRVLRQFVENGGRVLLVDCELPNLPHFFGHGMREFHGVGSYAGNCGFSLDNRLFSSSGDYGHLGESYAQGYPRIHAQLDDVVKHQYTPLSFHVVPYQFGHPDDINWGCSSFTGSFGEGDFWCFQFHLDEFILKSPATTADFIQLIEDMRCSKTVNVTSNKDKELTLSH